MAESAGDLTTDTAALLASEEHEVSIVGRSPWYLAWRRLRRNYVALFALLVFLFIVICCSIAPVYARHIAHTGPNAIHADEQVRVSGKLTPVVSGGGGYNRENQTVRGAGRPSPGATGWDGPCRGLPAAP